MRKSQFEKEERAMIIAYYAILAVNLLMVVGFAWVVYKVGAFFGIW